MLGVQPTPSRSLLCLVIFCPPSVSTPSDYLCLAIRLLYFSLGPALEFPEQINRFLRCCVGDAVLVVDPHSLPRALKRSGPVARLALGQSYAVVHPGILAIVDAEGRQRCATNQPLYLCDGG